MSGIAERRRLISLRSSALLRSIMATAGLLALLHAQKGHTEPARAPAGIAHMDQGRLCMDAVRVAERRYTLPVGLLLAIGVVESGRNDPATQQRQPWPWAVQAGDQGYYFESKTQAVQWVRDALKHGLTSIDTGCMQVNLHFHADAFPTIEDAFDPMLNADYAARFLLQLHVETGDWRQATGFYHSHTLEFATPYQARVARVLGETALPWTLPQKVPILSKNLSTAWGATIPSIPPPPPHPAGNDWSVLLHTSSRFRTALSSSW
jgi:hypothetical protein